MKSLILIVALCLICPTLFAQNKKASAKTRIPSETATVILGITGVNDIDSDSTEPQATEGGAMGMKRMFSTQLYPALKPCGIILYKVASLWIKENKLRTSNESLSDTEVLLESWGIDNDGLFELKYTCTEDGTYARVWLNYYTIKGEKIDPAAVLELYEKYNISDLWDKLQRGMGCSLD